MLCLPCRVSKKGLIMAVPGDGIAMEDLERGQQAEADDLLGPSLLITVGAEEEHDTQLEVMLVEFTVDVRHHLDRKDQRTRRQFLRFGSFAELDDAVEGGS